MGEQPQRAVEEYPEFEAEFELPPGLDLTIPPQVAFPPRSRPQLGHSPDHAPGTASRLLDQGSH